jgi:hypothetical protein
LKTILYSNKFFTILEEPSRKSSQNPLGDRVYGGDPGDHHRQTIRREIQMVHHIRGSGCQVSFFSPQITLVSLNKFAYSFLHYKKVYHSTTAADYSQNWNTNSALVL